MTRGVGRAALAAAATGAAGGLAYRLVVTGAATVDLGWGRSRRPLGPIEVEMAAPRDVVLRVISGPYLKRTPRAMSDKIQVLERSDGMVLAAHRTPLRWGMSATTVETVRFEPPDLVAFRLLRGPVPEVTETFRLHETADGTRLVYTGELGADLWTLGRWWGGVVAATWERTVRSSLGAVRVEAERVAATSAARGAGGGTT